MFICFSCFKLIYLLADTAKGFFFVKIFKFLCNTIIRDCIFYFFLVIVTYIKPFFFPHIYCGSSVQNSTQPTNSLASLNILHSTSAASQRTCLVLTLYLLYPALKENHNKSKRSSAINIYLFFSFIFTRKY